MNGEETQKEEKKYSGGPLRGETLVNLLSVLTAMEWMHEVNNCIYYLLYYVSGTAMCFSGLKDLTLSFM